MHNFGGGRSELFNSGGGGQKERGKGYFQNSGGSWLKGGVMTLASWNPKP